MLPHHGAGNLPGKENVFLVFAHSAIGVTGNALAVHIYF
jgi:hypothetical protein